jgi:diaminopropionate ammonia-lyase
MTAGIFQPLPLRHLANPAALPAGSLYPDSLKATLSRVDGLRALAEIASWPGYAPTPLDDLPGLAKALGIARLWYKDEGERFGLGSFKALGGAYAVYRYLAEAVAGKTGERPKAAELIAGRHREATKELTVATATDGNHGRSVAWGASLFGCRAVIFIHGSVSQGRKSAIEAFGAEVRRVPGNYDDSVHACAAAAAAAGWQVISDTGYAGYEEIPRQVMQGYAAMAEEIIGQLPLGVRPTHLFLQAGCGGLAAAVAAHLWESWQAGRPRLVVVEPERADCVWRSLEAGNPVRVMGELDTIMAGLACGEVSLVAWDVLRLAAADALAISDDGATAAMRALAEGTAGDPKIVAGEAGVGGLAGLMAVAGDEDRRRKLGLGPTSRVLVIGSEGATDPALYREIVGRAPESVAAADPKSCQ